jgi:hypothetical protein
MEQEMDISREKEPLIIAQAALDAAVAELEALPHTLNLTATRDVDNVIVMMKMMHNIQVSIASYTVEAA